MRRIIIIDLSDINPDSERMDDIYNTLDDNSIPYEEYTHI